MGPNRGLGKYLLVFTAVFISLSILTLPSQAEPASPANACISGAQNTWNNASFATQSAPFTAAYDATPSQNDMNGVIGFSLNPATDYTNLAAITRFNPNGMIDVRNGGNYAADLSLPYTAGQPYHFRLVISPTAHQYSVYVTPPGGSELALASNYAFRSEQSGTSSLNNWAVYSEIGTESVCNMTIAASSGSTAVAPTITTQPASQTIIAGQTAKFSVTATGTAPLSYQWRQNGTAISGATSSSYTTPAETTSANGAQFTVLVSNTAGSVTSALATLNVSAAQVCISGAQNTWNNASFATQSAPFTAAYDATPSQNDMNGVIGFSLNPATDYTNLAAITRFNPNGMIDVRNGGNYAADLSLPYTAGQPYHFRLVISPTAHQYSVYVTPPGGSELALASNYAFRSEQSGTSSLNNWAVYSEIGTESVCNMTIAASSGSTAVAPTITTQPASQTIIAGQTAKFSVTATGTAPLSYQWRQNGTAISGATSSSYTTPAETTSANGAQFTVLVSNTAGSVTSALATLNVSAAQVCISGAQNTWNNASFATQSAPFTAAYDATPSQNDMNGVIGFSLNPATDYTNLAAITRFNPNGMIDVRNGGNYAADLSLPYTAGQPYHFRLVINPATRQYSVYVTPPGGSELALASNYAFRSEQSGTSSLNNWAVYSEIGTESVCNMTIAASSGSTAVAPTITTQPASQTIIAGQTAKFSVTATGTAPLSYQWRQNGTAISGATSSSYTTPAETTSANGAQFTVLVSNTAGSVTSAAATLNVTAPGTLSLSSSTLAFGNVNVGTSSNLSATLTNSGSSSVTISGVSISGPGFSASGISFGQIIPAGQTATLNVTFTPAATGSVTGNTTITSNTSNSPTIISFTGTGAAVISHSAKLSWIASTSAVIGYYVYRGTISGGPFTRLTASVDAAITYSDNTVQSGQTYYYVVTAVGSNNIESVYSNQVSATIP